MHCKWLIGLGCSVIGAAAFAGVFYPEGATTLHFAFEGSPNGDRPIVRPPAFYAEDAGFGFVDSPGLVGNANGVQAPKYFRFDMNLPPGNYDVTARVGGPQASNLTIRSESHRAMLYNFATAARGNSTVTFTVNVQANPNASMLDYDKRLTLEFSGENPSLMKLDVKPNTTAPTLFILGNKDAEDSERIANTGWGQMLPLFFKPSEVAVANCSVQVLAPSVAEERLKAVKKGDMVLLSMQDQSGTFNATAEVVDRASYAAKFKGLLGNISKAGAQVILVTRVTRPFDAQGNAVSSGNQLNGWMREVAAAEKVPLIDLEAIAGKWFGSLSPEASKSVFTPADPKSPAGVLEDGLTPYGAFEVARLLAMAIRDSKTDLAARLYPEIPPSNSDPKQFPASLGSDFLKKDP